MGVVTMWQDPSRLAAKNCQCLFSWALQVIRRFVYFFFSSMLRYTYVYSNFVYVMRLQLGWHESEHSKLWNLNMCVGRVSCITAACKTIPCGIAVLGWNGTGDWKYSVVAKHDQCSGQRCAESSHPTGFPEVRCHRTHRLLQLVRRHALTTIKTIANIHRSLRPVFHTALRDMIPAKGETPPRLGCWLFKVLM